MRSGFRFKNRHSNEFGAVVKTKSKPILPEQKIYTFDSPNIDGEYDFTDCNIYGRELYKDRMFELELQITADNLIDLQRKSAMIAAWLMGSGTLAFDDSNGTIWNARISSDVAFLPEQRGKFATMTVMFRVPPSGTATFNTVGGLSLADSISLDSNLPLDIAERFKFKLLQGENNISVMNMGDFYVRPTLSISDLNGDISIKHGDSKISVEDVNGDISIDLERCNVTDNKGECILSRTHGDFFELKSGETTLEIYCTSECFMEVKYSPKTIYDFDFSRLDWGDGDA